MVTENHPWIDHGWSSVRCVFRTAFEPTTYEERITLWKTSDLQLAIERAEKEAEEYAANVGAEYLGYAQAYGGTEEPVDGAEIFSLMRESNLDPEEYVDAFFDTGGEREADAQIVKE